MLCALSNLPEDDPTIQSEFNAVKDTVFEMAQGRFTDCFAMNKNRNLHRTILAYVNQMFQQISGMFISQNAPDSVDLSLTITSGINIITVSIEAGDDT